MSRHNAGTSRMRQLAQSWLGRAEDDLLRSASRAVTTSATLDEMLMTVAAAYRADCEAATAHVFKISARRARACRVGSALADAYSAPRSEQESAFLGELAWWASAEDQVCITRDLDGDALVCVPISADRACYAVVVVQHPQRALNADDRLRWMEVGTLIGQTIASWSTGALDGALAAMARRLPALVTSLSENQRLEHALAVIADGIQGIVRFDYISISSLGGSRQHEDRVAFLATSNRIVESRRGWPIAESATARLLDRGQVLITPDLAAADGECDNEPWEYRLGMRSRLILPVRSAGRIVGTMTLASKIVAAYGEDEVMTLAPLNAVLSNWFAVLLSTSRLVHAERVQNRLAALSGSDEVWPGEERLLHDVIADLPVSGLRVFKLEEGGDHLREITTAGRIAKDSVITRVPLGRAPWHRWALESRRVLTVNQSDPEAMMSAPESELAMTSRVKTACLVPIVHEGRSLGVLDAIEERHPDRSLLNAGDHMLLTTLADTIARHWTEDEAKPASASETASESLSSSVRRLNRDVINPLTAIIGSVELMRYKSAPISPDCQKYMTTIERAASRIHDAVRTILAGLDNDANGNGRQPVSTGAEPSMNHWNQHGREDSGDGGLLGFTRPASVRQAASARRDDDELVTSATDATVVG